MPFPSDVDYYQDPWKRIWTTFIGCFSVVYPLINSLKEKSKLILNSIDEDCNDINISIDQNDESSEIT